MLSPDGRKGRERSRLLNRSTHLYQEYIQPRSLQVSMKDVRIQFVEALYRIIAWEELTYTEILTAHPVLSILAFMIVTPTFICAHS